MKKIIPLCLFISALGVDHYELIIENKTNEEVTLETSHKIGGLNLDMKSDIMIKANRTNSHIVTIANNCKDSLLRVSNQHEECIPVGFSFPKEIRSTEESVQLPRTKLTIEGHNNDIVKKNKANIQKKNDNHCSVKVLELNK